jgi:hypothetical protein
MTSPLEGALKAKIAAAFKGKLTLGSIRRDGTTSVDGVGDEVPGTPSTYTFEGIRESFSTYTKAAAGIPDTDVSILVLLGSVKPVTIARQGDQIYLQAPWNKWHQVRRVLEIDPAEASQRLQAYEIPDPT